MNNERRSGTPARLSPHSRAAGAQRVDERPLPVPRGYYHPVANHRTHPKGWHLQHHLKRKKLQRSNEKYRAVDRVGTFWSLLPLAFAILAFLITAASLLTGYAAFSTAVDRRYQQDILTLADILPRDSLRMYDANGTQIYEAIDQGLQISEPFDKISPNLVHAEIAIEDQYFWSNPGYDITGIVRAALSDLTHGRIVAGGSTITQQLIKNAIVGNQDTAIRKLQEIILAPEVTRQYTKDQILSMYLNTTYYGEMAYGADAAAFTYFDLQDTPARTAASQLDIAQSAMLAGIPSSPIARDPFLHPQAAFLRMEDVLRQ